MIDNCFLHCDGIGPKTENALIQAGFRNWKQCMESPGDLPFGGKKRDRFLASLEESAARLSEKDIGYFVEAYPPREHWRVLGTFFQDAVFFDIETTGLSYYEDHVSVIAAFGNKKLHSFVQGENLDDFLDLLDETSLLVSFNGSSFDVPFLENSFHIPSIECPHIDLRWVAYHQGYDGGLKLIEKLLGVQRPEALREFDGMEAVRLYHRWQAGDDSCRGKLLAYCQADVLATGLVAGELMNEMDVTVTIDSPEDLFNMALRTLSSG